jgi:hypothetical protein
MSLITSVLSSLWKGIKQDDEDEHPEHVTHVDDFQGSLSFITNDPFYQEQCSVRDHPENADQNRLGTVPPLLQKDSLVHELVNKLSITRITNRIIACGLIVETPSLKQANNLNVDDVAAFMDMRYGGQYLVWNLAC